MAFKKRITNRGFSQIRADKSASIRENPRLINAFLKGELNPLAHALKR
jgi:hypothetical protein